MNKTIETSSLLAALFIVFIFWGDVWLIKITLPLSMLLVPLILLKRSRFILPLPEAAIPLLCLGTIIALQFIIYRNNPAFKFKSDLATWLPLTYAGITILALQNIKMTRILLLRALTFGGLLTSIIMLAMIIFAPSNMFLVPGQDAAQVEETYAETLANDHVTPIFTEPLQEKSTPAEPTSSSNITTPTSVETPITVPAINAHQPPPPAGREFVLINNTEKIFYDLKKKSKNFLGSSNYIAVFTTFIFAVALFSGSTFISVMFAAITFITLSRFSIMFISFITFVYFFWSNLNAIKAMAIIGIVFCVAVLAIFLWGGLPIPGTASITSRIEYWRSGIGALSLHPIIGSPRSVFLVDLGKSITWSPHNSVLWIAVNFGTIGVVAYFAYVWIVLKEIGKAARHSNLWTGVLIGLMALLAWSTVEIIVLTPAFEILFATMYILARSARVSSENENFSFNEAQKY